MTALLPYLIRRIRTDGPMPLSEYMDTCLMHPEHGYYTTQPPFGAQGDFITAPEISQMFGELIGLSLGQAWIDQGAPERFTLAELGPGRGTMMADILRATRGIPGFHAAMQLVLLEGSERLRAQQKQVLQHQDITWIKTTGDLPDQPLFLVANEFFDALPIRQFQRHKDGWRERCIGLDESEALIFGLAPTAPQPALTGRLTDTRDGDIVEISSASASIMSTIDHKIARFGGIALIIDYGDWRSLGDTFQALRQHRYENPLACPGVADLTAHVDFEALTLAATTTRYSRLTPQGVFLERLGITQRAEALAAKLSGPDRQAHIQAHRRLTHPAEMGTLFKVLALYPKGAAPPPGLDP